MSAHQVLAQLYSAITSGPGKLKDPGNAGTIRLSPGISHGHIDLKSAAAETRTLADPPAAGLELFLSHKTDGGDITMTCTSAVNEAGATSLVFSAVGQCVLLKSVEDAAGTFAWRVIHSDGVTGTGLQGAALTAQLTSITIADAAGTPDYALQAVINTNAYGFASAAEAISTLYVIQNLQVRLAEVEARLEGLGLVAAN